MRRVLTWEKVYIYEKSFDLRKGLYMRRVLTWEKVYIWEEFWLEKRFIYEKSFDSRKGLYMRRVLTREKVYIWEEFWLEKRFIYEKSFEMWICFWQSSIILRLSCAGGRMLKYCYWLTQERKYCLPSNWTPVNKDFDINWIRQGQAVWDKDHIIAPLSLPYFVIIIFICDNWPYYYVWGW